VRVKQIIYEGTQAV